MSPTPPAGAAIPLVGAEVRVFDQNGAQMGQPRGGWVGHVTKVGRSLVTIGLEGRHRELVFRIDTRRSHDGFGGKWFESPEEAAAKAERGALEEALRTAGVEVFRARLTVDQLRRLAAVVTESGGEGDG
jgi:hypothetical protein